MKLSKELVIGLVLVLISAYYWGALSKADLSTVPLFFRYTFRLAPYSDLFVTIVGMLVFYRGLRKLKE